MITSLRLVDFKNFADETLKLGPFTVIVGANASGKSNIRDAFRFLHGIGRGYTLAEILGGKYVAGGQLEWAPIRGAMNEVVRIRLNTTGVPVTFRILTEFTFDDRSVSYAIRIGFGTNGSNEFQVMAEELRTSEGSVYESAVSAGSGLSLILGNAKDRRVAIGCTEPALRRVFDRRDWWDAVRPETTEKDSRKSLQDHYERIMADEVAFKTIEFLIRIGFLELSPSVMRWPSVPGAIKLGESGDNLPTVLKAICSDTQRREVLTSWLRELTPMDVEDFEFPRDPSGRIHLQLLEKNGRRISVSSASDGTLRFLGILAALLGPNPAGLYFFEEIDNGIHPSRLHLLIELIERQTAKNGIQVVATTHSPDVLNLINDTTFNNASVVYRDEDSADAIIRPVAELPKVRELRKSQGLGRLHASGWMEDILAFESADAEAVE